MLRPNGELLEAPQFFQDALALEARQVPSIYHLFDDREMPYLSFERIARRQNGIYEFYVNVIDEHDHIRGFRYWSISPNQSNRKQLPVTFYIVDESSLLQNQEWHLRRLRRDMLNHVRVSLNQFVRQRLTSIQALTELIRDNPKIAKESSERLLENLGALIASLDDVIDTNVIYDGLDAPRLKLERVPEVVSNWSAPDQAKIRARGHGLASSALVPTEYLERILMPLVQNALEASMPDETVEVDVWELGNGFCRIDVSDQGEGMSEFTRAKAEDPFYSTKPGHLGLGLSQAYEALQSIGGHWRLDSVPGDGTRVTLLLPVEDPEELQWLASQLEAPGLGG